LFFFTFFNPYKPWQEPLLDLAYSLEAKLKLWAAECEPPLGLVVMEKMNLCELSASLTCQVSSPQECFDEEREGGGGGGVVGVVGGRR